MEVYQRPVCKPAAATAEWCCFSIPQQAMLNKWRFRESAFDNTVLGVQVSSWMSEMVVDELVQCLALCTFSALLFRRRVCWISTRLYCVALASTQLS